MRYVSVAVGSFVLGMLFTGLSGFSGSQTSTILHNVAFAQNKSAAPSPPPIPADFQLNSSTPVVPAPPRTISSGNIVEFQTIQLDGRTSEGETIRNSTIVYGGGAYSLINARLELPINIQFVGAAWNTRQFLAGFGLIGRPGPTPKTAPHMDRNVPSVKTIKLTTAISGDFVSPNNGGK